MRGRPSIDRTMLTIAVVLSQRSTCSRRKVGCVLVNDLNHIIGSGYNGVAKSQEHCTTVPCKGAALPSGTGLDLCEAIHAEANALLQCKDVQSIHTVYCTHAPCVHCVKLIMNTSAQRICFLNDYPHSTESRRLWVGLQGHDLMSWFKFSPTRDA